MIGASVWLPYLPMTPIQILTNNLLYDFSQVPIPTNTVVPQQIAKDEDVSTQLVSKLEENMPTEREEWVAALLGDCNLSSQAYFGSLKRVLLKIAIPGNAVIVGKGSNCFLPPDKKIGLCFVAPLDLRIKNTMKELGLSEKDAREHISKLEAEHRKLVKKYFQAEIRDSTHYHLVVNTALVKPETIIQIVKMLITAQT